MALSDPEGILASPLTIINRTEENADIEAIVDIVRDKGVGRVVIGLPLSMDGTEGIQVNKVRAFEKKLRGRAGVPVAFWDERLTTVSARRIVQEVRKKSKKAVRYDDIAATIILQGYLDKAF